MNSSDFRKEAREKLSGNWGKAALMTLVYFGITAIISFISNKFKESSLSILFTIFQYVVSIPIVYGLTNSFIKIFDKKDVTAFDFISTGFNNFSRSWGVTLNVLLKILLPIILLILSIIIFEVNIVGTIISNTSKAITLANLETYISSSIASFSGVILISFILYIVSLILLITWSYYYQLSQIIAIDNPNITTKEAVMKSKECMTGNRWKLFCLEFSFIGWAFLCIFTLGIGYFWLLPYMTISQISFARFVYGKNKN